jgi:hypothetical protein
MPDGQGGSGFFKALIDGRLGYAWFALLAIWGGTVNYISRVRRNKNVRFNFVELIGEWTISAFAGIMTALICQEMGMSMLLTSAFAGIGGHMGGRAIYMIEQYACRKFGVRPTNRVQPDDKDKETTKTKTD